MDLAEIGAALETLPTARGRGEIKPGPNQSTLIDDSYNANRQSILAIVNAMRKSTQAPNARRWAVLGDIFELGSFAPAEHRAVGEALAGQIDYLVAVGEQARFYVEGALAAGMPEQNAYYYSADVNDTAQLVAVKRAVADLLLQDVRCNDLVLIKGSRGMCMETLISLLQREEFLPQKA
jgi:UDP-N-acetylmuramoyl-tripeptide--D-alanyl-D-alanine ligase